MKYQINQITKGPLRLFGKSFVKLNKYRYRIIYNNKIKEIQEFFENINEKYKNKEMLSIKLRIFNNIINGNSMFKGCNSLISISNLSEKYKNKK